MWIQAYQKISMDVPWESAEKTQGFSNFLQNATTHLHKMPSYGIVSREFDVIYTLTLKLRLKLVKKKKEKG